MEETIIVNKTPTPLTFVGHTAIGGYASRTVPTSQITAEIIAARDAGTIQMFTSQFAVRSKTGFLDSINKNGLPFRVYADRGFNITAWGTFAGTVVVERSFDEGLNWHGKWPDAIYQFTRPISFTDNEPEANVLYRLRALSLTGKMFYRLSQ